jgi:cell division protein FtsZ
VPADRDTAYQVSPEIESQVEAAVAEAITYEEAYADYTEDDGVTVEPYIPAASHAPVEEPAYEPEQPVPSVYVPSHAERPDGQRRMPRTEELPVVARRTQEAHEKHDAEPRNARALFKRLASNVGIGLRGEHERGHEENHYPDQDDAAARSAIEAGGARVSHAPQARDGAAGGQDPYGRQQAPQPAKDHLEIPAFLRKHG